MWYTKLRRGEHTAWLPVGDFYRIRMIWCKTIECLSGGREIKSFTICADKWNIPRQPLNQSHFYDSWAYASLIEWNFVFHPIYRLFGGDLRRIIGGEFETE